MQRRPDSVLRLVFVYCYFRTNKWGKVRDGLEWSVTKQKNAPFSINMFPETTGDVRASDRPFFHREFMRLSWSDEMNGIRFTWPHLKVHKPFFFDARTLCFLQTAQRWCLVMRDCNLGVTPYGILPSFLCLKMFFIHVGGRFSLQDVFAFPLTQYILINKIKIKY